jgi:hypothetical protein
MITLIPTRMRTLATMVMPTIMSQVTITLAMTTLMMTPAGITTLAATTTPAIIPGGAIILAAAARTIKGGYKC